MFLLIRSNQTSRIKVHHISIHLATTYRTREYVGVPRVTVLLILKTTHE